MQQIAPHPLLYLPLPTPGRPWRRRGKRVQAPLDVQVFLRVWRCAMASLRGHKQGKGKRRLMTRKEARAAIAQVSEEEIKKIASDWCCHSSA